MPQDAVSALIWSATKKNMRESFRHSAKLVIDSLTDRLATGEQLTATGVLKLAANSGVASETRKPSTFLALLGTLPPSRAEIVARHMLARAQRNLGVRKAWADPQKRKSMSQALLDVDHSRPETTKRLSEASRRSWADTETRKRRIEGLRYGAQQRSSYLITPEGSKRLSEANRRRWEDPEKRKRWSEAMRRAWADPEKRERFIEAIRRAWEMPETKKKQSEGLRRAWARPEGRKQQSERMKRQWGKLAEAERILAQRTPEEMTKAARLTVAAGLELKKVTKYQISLSLFPEQNVRKLAVNNTIKFFGRNRDEIGAERIRLCGLSDDIREAAIQAAISYLARQAKSQQK